MLKTITNNKIELSKQFIVMKVMQMWSLSWIILLSFTVPLWYTHFLSIATPALGGR